METGRKKIKLALVDDHNLFRKGLIKLIQLADAENKYEILFEAEDGNDLKKKIDINDLPDIVLMDIDMPGVDGFEAAEWLKNYHPGIDVLVVTMFEKEADVLRMLRIGIKGYLSKDIEVEDMHRALEAISNKGLFYAGFVTELISRELSDRRANPAAKGPAGDDFFSETELTFLKLACTELTYVQIADKMNVSPKTVDGYRDGLFKRLDIKSRVSLAMFAVKKGLVRF